MDGTMPSLTLFSHVLHKKIEGQLGYQILLIQSKEKNFKWSHANERSTSSEGRVRKLLINCIGIAQLNVSDLQKASKCDYSDVKIQLMQKVICFKIA